MEVDDDGRERENEAGAIGCEEALERLAEYLDRELDAAQAAALERHLEKCRSCYSRREFERRLRARIRRDLGMEGVPPAFEERVRTMVRGFAGSPRGRGS